MAASKKPKKKLSEHHWPSILTVPALSLAITGLFLLASHNPKTDYLIEESKKTNNEQTVRTDQRSQQGKVVGGASGGKENSGGSQRGDVGRVPPPEGAIVPAAGQRLNQAAEAQRSLVTSITVGDEIKFSKSGELYYFDATVHTNKGPAPGKVPQYVLQGTGVDIVYSIMGALSPESRVSPEDAARIARQLTPDLQRLKARRNGSENLLQAQAGEALDFNLGG